MDTKPSNCSPSLEEEKYRNILAQIEEGYYETDLTGQFTYVNPAGCMHLGRSADELVRTDYRACMSPDTAQMIFGTFNQVFATGHPVGSIECDIIHPDGSLRTLEISVSLLRQASGEPIGFFGISRDRTERLVMERALRESEESYRSIMDLSPDAITINEVGTGRYVAANAAFFRKTGYGAGEVIGRTPEELGLFALPQERKQFIDDLMRDRLDGLEMQFRRRDGAILENLVSGRRIRFKGRPCFLFVATEIASLKRAQQALRDSEESYRQVLELAPDAISLTRVSDGKYLEVSDAFCMQTGYTRAETVGRRSLDLNLYADPTQRKMLIAGLRERGQVQGMEIGYRAKDGTILQALTSARAIRFKGEACVLAVSTLINDLKAAQRALRKSEESYRKVIQSTPIAMGILSASDSRYVDVNEAFIQTTGYTREEVIGHTPMELNMYADGANRQKLIEDLAREGQIRGIELRLRNKDGDVLDSLISITPIHYKGEACLLTSAVDLTVVKAFQKALQESEENHRKILDGAPYSILITRRSDLRFVRVNDNFCRRMGYSRQEVLGRTSLELGFYVNPDDRRRFYEKLKEEGQVDGMEIDFRSKSGRIITNLMSALPIRFDGQDCVLSMTVDITARKRAEQELERYRRHLEEMVQERTQALESAQAELVKSEKLAVLGQLTATVSHELRNPLGVIRSSNFFLQRKVKEKDEKIHKHFKRIDDQVSMCDAIVADLLEYTRGRSVSMVNEDLAPWLAQIVEQCQESEGMAIKMDFSSDLPAIPHDQEKMRRVIINVLDNAVQAVRAREQAEKAAGVPFVSDIAVSMIADGDRVVIQVTDNGSGMREETLQRAFEPLFTTRARGTGIGLAIVKKIVDEHHGSTSLESCPGKGTRVTIALPCGAKSVPPPNPDRSSSRS